MCNTWIRVSYDKSYRALWPRHTCWLKVKCYLEVLSGQPFLACMTLGLGPLKRFPVGWTLELVRCDICRHGLMARKRVKGVSLFSLAVSHGRKSARWERNPGKADWRRWHWGHTVALCPAFFRWTPGHSQKYPMMTKTNKDDNWTTWLHAFACQS